MRPLCHQCQTKPADIVEDKILWCAVCKVHDLRVKGEMKVTRPVLTNTTKKRYINKNFDFTPVMLQR